MEVREKMNLAWLQTFNEIVEQGSLTGAARALHLTQPAVSKQLHSLEEYYGTPLFYRTTRRLELTPAGEVVYRYSQKAVDLIFKSKREVETRSRVLEGELRLGASNIPGEYLLPRLLGLFQQRYPGIRVRLEIEDSREIAQRVAEGKLELGLTGAVMKSRKLNFEPLLQDELVVVVPAGHPLAGKASLTPGELLAEPLVARERGSGTRQTVETRLQEHGLNPALLKVSLELGSTEAVLNAVAQGAGISLVSARAARPLARSGKIACLEVEGIPFRRYFYLVTRKRREPGIISRAFMEFLKEQLSLPATEETSA